ncbi:MAG: chalcone isomerase family protein [Acidobacteria bacterium]|nr:chalcone isomerase family protein [Acidobacteriota bacterium]MBV9478451.1 chalcone isomerase family protein [Acidobacteriota bacterium]
MRKLLLAATLVLAAAAANAATVAGVTLEDRTSVNNQTLVLNGAALRKKLFIKVYVGGLYLPAKQTSAATVIATDAPRRMVLHFLFSVSKSQMADAWQEGLEDNTPNASPEVKTAFKTLQSWMEDVPSGHTIVLTYVPGIGTTVEVNGKSKGTLGGKATSDAILNTWIGPKPGPGDDFKKAVLGQH